MTKRDLQKEFLTWKEIFLLTNLALFYFSSSFNLNENTTGWSLLGYKPISMQKTTQRFYYCCCSSSPFIVVRDNSVFPFSCHLFWVLWTLRKRPDYLRPSQANDKKKRRRSNLQISRTFRNRIPDFVLVHSPSSIIARYEFKNSSYRRGREIPVKIRLWSLFDEVCRFVIVLCLFSQTEKELSAKSTKNWLNFQKVPNKYSRHLKILRNDKELLEFGILNFAAKKWRIFNF